MFKIIAQAIGICAMIIDVLSYQAKSHRGIVVMQLASSMLYTVNIYMLSGFVMGAFLNLAGILRSIVFSNKERFHADKKVWLYGFCGLYFVLYALTFTVFGIEPTPLRLFMEFLPLIGMCSTTVGYYMTSARDIRIVGFINSPCWFCYHLYNGSIGGVLSSVFIIISIIVGMLRFSGKKEKGRDEDNK